MANVAIIGAGLIGRAWALVARGGHRVRLWDSQPAQVGQALASRARWRRAWRRRACCAGARWTSCWRRWSPSGAWRTRCGTPTTCRKARPNVGQQASRLCRAGSPGAGWRDPGQLDLGAAAFAFTADLPGRARCLVAHPINPPYLVPAVEIVPAPWTDAACVERARSLLAEAGQQPIVMRREIDGFVVNRLQGALLHEAFRLVADGYAGVEDVDTCIRDGLALRWAFMGPFETIDLNAPAGVRDYAERYEGMYAEMFESMTRRVPWSGATLDRVEAQRREHLPADGLAQRQIWRDLRLMELAAHKERLRQGRECPEPHSLSDC